MIQLVTFMIELNLYGSVIAFERYFGFVVSEKFVEESETDMHTLNCTQNLSSKQEMQSHSARNTNNCSHIHS